MWRLCPSEKDPFPRWVVDPELDVVRVYRSDGEGFGKPIELSNEAGDVLTTALLPQLELPLARIFADM
jgi:Uma2 family endonuclease